MDSHIRLLRKEELLVEHGGWFDEENAERVVSWLVAAEDRRPVVLVGAGFSLNARDRETGNPATRDQAPLWSDVVNRLAADMDVSPTRYDAPTLFELYQESLSDAKLRDALRDCFADNALIPGRAHEMLAAYSCEAIVTTNCLDTLLDKVCSTGWRRVVEDADLSKHGQLRDLVYLHGHRDYSESWIMTRSQYEDFHRTRPVMVARTRQLLAQHPWLVVGFGMSDPNFHSLTRLLGSEMQGHQPLSLVLMRDLPHAAERQHWRRLGFEIAAPDHRNRDLGEFFAWIFPKLATQYSPTSEAARAYIQRGATPIEQLRRFRAVNPAPIVDREAVYRAWETQLKGLLSEEERAKALEAAQAAAQEIFDSRLRTAATRTEYSVTTSPPASPRMSSELLKALDGEPTFGQLSQYERAHWLDRLLQIEHTIRVELAEHFAWALHQRLFEEAEPRPLMEIVTFQLAKDAGWSQDRVSGLIKSLLVTVRKYAEKEIEAVLGKHLTRLGFYLPSADAAPSEPHLVDAEAGYRAFMDGDIARAGACYRKAAKRAAAAGLDFETWVYTQGAAHAIDDDSKSSEDELELKALSAQIRRLSLRPVVEKWVERADARLRMILRETVEEGRIRDRNRSTGGKGMRVSNAANLLWRAYRDLYAIHAPPFLQRRYIEPLASFLDETDLRIVVANVSKPREWLAEFLRGAPLNVLDREKRDATIVRAVLFEEQDNLTRAERRACLDCARQLTSVLRVSDVQRALKWLEKLASEPIAAWKTTGWATRATTDAFWDAFSSLAMWAGSTEALDVGRTLIAQLGSRFTDGAVRALYELPWQRWRLAHDEAARGFVELLTNLLDERARWLHGTFSYAFIALLRMLRAGLDPAILRPYVERWQAALGDVCARTDDATRRSDGTRAGFWLERELQEKKLVPAKGLPELFASWFDGGELAPEDDDTTDAREAIWEVLEEAFDDSEIVADPLRHRLGLEARSIAADTSLLRRYELNPHLAASALGVLARAHKVFPTDRPAIGPALLKLVALAPEQVDSIGCAIDRELWNADHWNKLTSVLIATCGGATKTSKSHRDDPGLGTRCQSAVFSMLTKLDGTNLRRDQTAFWHVLQGSALASVNDERLGVAYRASFAVAELASDVTEETEAALFAGAIRRISGDGRAEIRSAVARVAHTLIARARHPLVREAARHAASELVRDANAQVTCLLANSQPQSQTEQALTVPSPPEPGSPTSGPDSGNGAAESN